MSLGLLTGCSTFLAGVVPFDKDTPSQQVGIIKTSSLCLTLGSWIAILRKIGFEMLAAFQLQEPNRSALGLASQALHTTLARDSNDNNSLDQFSFLAGYG